jgi:hypothetical protein
MILKRSYSQNDWKTRSTFINQHNEHVKLRMKLFEGENGRLVAIIAYTTFLFR